jgi:hypothetical protein
MLLSFAVGKELFGSRYDINQNAPSTKMSDYDWLMGIFTKAVSIR